MPVETRGLLTEEELDRRAEAEVLDEARDVVAELELRLQQARTGGLDPATAAKALLQHAVNLRLKARSVNVPGLGPLTHRLEDYLVGLRNPGPDNIADLQTFADRIAAVLDGDAVPPEAVAEVVRQLPKKATFEVSDITIAHVEITLVMAQRTAARVIERELAACGYAVSTVLDPFDALELIVQTRPDLVVTGMVMPRLSGVDLACAVAAMPATKAIPVAVLTSLTPDHPDLAALPMNAGLIRRGPQFGDDLAHVLNRFGIT
jgi:CheY-like chemotaxis protein